MGKANRLLLAAVFCSDYPAERSGVYVRVWNAGAAPADLAGTVLEWDGVPLVFPGGGRPLAPGAGAHVAWDADGVRRLLARAPDYCVTGSGSGAVPQLQPAPGGGGAPRVLQPAGGSVRLLTRQGKVLDAFAWGEGTGMAPAGLGVVYQRAIVEKSLGPASAGRFVKGASAPAAWRQGTDWLPRRLVRPGQSELSYPTFAVERTQLFVCPDCSFEVISQFIDQAERTLAINIYLFTQADLAGRVEAAIQRQVDVSLLMEGEPYEGMPPSDRDTLVRLQAAGARVRILHATPDGFRRYRWDHAKYAVADERRCLILSDNWTNSSAPPQPVTGQRGWGAVLDSSPLAAHLLSIFAADSNPQSPDSISFEPNNSTHIPPVVAPLAVAGDPQRVIDDPIHPKQLGGTLSATLFTAPDHALLETKGICGLIRGAARTLDVQQNSIQLYWALGAEGSVETTPDLFLAEVVAAARRGVRVRVLLDGSYLNPDDPRENGHTRDWLQALAVRESLPLEARILDRSATGMGIHNKGLIVDGRQVLISSINWSQNSPLENRELGLVLESPAAAAYFGAAFDRDWAGGK